jgi:protein-S-isoprenylcysteine O-methyltransferase Ste14
VLLIYAAAVALAFAAFVRFYEQPVLTRRYGEQYREYCDRVPAWLPSWPMTGKR